MKKRVAYITIGILILLAIFAAGGYAYTNIRVTDEKVFRSYVEKGVTAKQLTQTETYEGTGSKTALKGLLDSQKKTTNISADIVCTATVEGKEVNLDASIQQENDKVYYRVNSISGEVDNSDGNTLNLTSVFSKVKGVWYVSPDSDKAVKAQLDSGVFIFNSVLVAPSYDTNKVVDALINKKAFTYSHIEKVDDNYVISFSVHRDKYIEVVKEMFPNLSNVDLIMDSIFEDKSSIESTITVKKDGTHIKEELTNKNLCVDLITTFVGLEPKGLAENLTGVNESKPAGSITITPVTNSKPLDQLSSDFVL